MKNVNFKHIQVQGLNLGYITADGEDTNETEDFHALVSKAGSGDKSALVKIGSFYEYGASFESNNQQITILKDIQTAIEIYKTASANGSGIAFYRLGDIYYHGVDIISNKELAYFFFRSGAKLNEPNSLFFLGTLDFNSGNVTEAFEKIKAAADLGHPEACYNVALALYKGDIVWKKNLPSALGYIHKAWQPDQDNIQYSKLMSLIKNELFS